MIQRKNNIIWGVLSVVEDNIGTDAKQASTAFIETSPTVLREKGLLTWQNSKIIQIM